MLSPLRVLHVSCCVSVGQALEGKNYSPLLFLEMSFSKIGSSDPLLPRTAAELAWLPHSIASEKRRLEPSSVGGQCRCRRRRKRSRRRSASSSTNCLAHEANVEQIFSRAGLLADPNLDPSYLATLVKVGYNKKACKPLVQ